MVDDLFSSSHPLLPPKTEDDQLDWLRLLRSRRVGISTFYRLLAEHGTAQNALEHLPDIAQSRGLAGYRACSQKDAMRELPQGIKFKNCRRHRIAAGIKLPQASNCRRHQIGFAIKF